MPLYESTFIARQDIAQSDVEKISADLSSIIEEGKGKVVKTEYWGLRNLAYKINKNRKGHYGFLGIDAPVDAIKEMERKLRLNEDVIRTMTIRVDAIEDDQSAPLQTGSRYDKEGTK